MRKGLFPEIRHAGSGVLHKTSIFFKGNNDG